MTKEQARLRLNRIFVNLLIWVADQSTGEIKQKLMYQEQVAELFVVMRIYMGKFKKSTFCICTDQLHHCILLC